MVETIKTILTIVLMAILFSQNIYCQKNIKTAKTVNVKKNAFTVKEKENIKNALKALNKLKNAVEIGTNFKDFNQNLIDCKTDFEEYLKEFPDGIIKDTLKSNMSSYLYAHKTWKEFLDIDSGEVGQAVIKVTMPQILDGTTAQTKRIDDFITSILSKK